MRRSTSVRSSDSGSPWSQWGKSDAATPLPRTRTRSCRADVDGVITMNARVAQFSGQIATFLGLGFVVFGLVLALLALAVDVPWRHLTGKALLEQTMTAVPVGLAGLLTGVPFIILGQIMLVLMRQSHLLERIEQAFGRRSAPNDEVVSRAA